MFAAKLAGSGNVRFGSITDIERCKVDVRFTPESGHRNAVVECLLCAKSRHRALFNHLVSKLLELIRHVET